jgi:hypothetical protein
MHPIGVYFSPTTRNYFTRDFLASYQGIIILLLQHHMEYEVVTPRTVAQFHGETLVLPDVRVLSPEEKAVLAAYVAHQGKLVVTGENATGLAANQNVAIMRACPGKAHMAAIASNMTASDRSTEDAFFSSIHAQPAVEVFAPPLVATQIASVEGKPHIFFANFSGLVPGKNARQTPIGDIKIRLIGTTSTRLTFLPFLGQHQIIEGKRAGGATVFVLPSLEKGAVAWIDPVK